MEKQNFITLFKKDHKLCDSGYVHGRIFGIAEIICDLVGENEERVDKEGNTHFVRHMRGCLISDKDNGLWFMRMFCTQEQYEKFKEYVEEVYPGLCEFYHK